MLFDDKRKGIFFSVFRLLLKSQQICVEKMMEDSDMNYYYESTDDEDDDDDAEYCAKRQDPWKRPISRFSTLIF